MDHLDRTLLWELFQETGDPMGYVLYAAHVRTEAAGIMPRALGAGAEDRRKGPKATSVIHVQGGGC